MGFRTELVAKQTGDEDWELVAPLAYQANEETFEVPAGFVTNYASVPLVFRWLIPRSGRHSKAAVLHDFLWRTRRTSYAEADGLFRRALHDLGVPFLRRWIMWAAVRWASLWNSRLKDGPDDLAQVLLLTVFPGLFVIAGGLVVAALLLVFAAFEWLAAVPIALSRTLGLPRVKPYRRPAVLSHARPGTRTAE